ncbi:unnamed protein product [Dovyalis caffra]|uniref:Uncharacterized protein n=1 Tax=Dovyalis caffra TaxID=77055 RepID=A0AAV1RNX4_9ROSI|nr:unnamed protein product [Dovyalis caffra]
MKTFAKKEEVDIGVFTLSSHRLQSLYNSEALQDQVSIIHLEDKYRHTVENLQTKSHLLKVGNASIETGI